MSWRVINRQWHIGRRNVLVCVVKVRFRVGGEGEIYSLEWRRRI